MKNTAKALVFSLFLSVLGGLASPALAYSPTLSANYQGGNNNLQISIYNASPFSSVSLSSRQSSSLWTVVNNIGQTDASGYFTQVFSMPSDGSSSALMLYATVGGQQTQTVSVYPNGGGSGCTYNCGGNISLGQNSLNINIGQSSTVPVYNSSTGSAHISSNSNSNIASASLSGNQLNVYGNSLGSTTITVCANNGGSCATLYVTVTGSAGGSISLSQTSLNLNIGQSSVITVYNSNPGSFYISSNSNPTIVSVSVNGNQLNISGNGVGSASITVCASNNSSCVTLYVTVGNSGSGSLSLSQTSLNLNIGQSSIITAYSSYSGTYYISSNSNSSVATASINGSQITVYGQGTGSTNIVACQSGGSCATVYVTVGGSGCTYNCGSLSLSQTSLTLNSGQSASVNISGNGSYYISNNSNSYVAGASINGNTLNVYASAAGSTTIAVCQNNPSSCVNLFVTVSGSGSGFSNLYFNTVTLPTMVLGQYYSYQLQANGGNAPYTYTLTGGNLPNGLYISPAGLIYGTPTSGGTNFSVRASDIYGRNATANFTISGSNVSGGGLQYPGGGNVLGASIYPNGQLINEYGTVYIVYRNTKTSFASAQAFTGLGFKFSNVVSAGNSGLPDSGYIVRTSAASHPWGSWVKSGQTVYFVHESGLIPVPNLNTFYANGGQESFTVNANAYDLRLPRLSVMAVDDYRLK
jgi:hypothetical protein